MNSLQGYQINWRKTSNNYLTGVFFIIIIILFWSPQAINLYILNFMTSRYTVLLLKYLFWFFENNALYYFSQTEKAVHLFSEQLKVKLFSLYA